MPIRQQAIIWSNDGLVYWCICASLGLNKLTMTIYDDHGNPYYSWKDSLYIEMHPTCYPWLWACQSNRGVTCALNDPWQPLVAPPGSVACIAFRCQWENCWQMKKQRAKIFAHCFFMYQQFSCLYDLMAECKTAVSLVHKEIPHLVLTGNLWIRTWKRICWIFIWGNLEPDFSETCSLIYMKHTWGQSIGVTSLNSLRPIDTV